MRLLAVTALVFVFGLASYSDSTNVRAVETDSVRLIHQAVFAVPSSGATEVSTEVLEQILQNRSAVVLDTRPHREWSISHIPSAINVAPKPGVPMALYTSDVAEVGRLRRHPLIE